MKAAIDLRLDEARFAVIDVETTGLRAGWDRIVEVAVFHVGGGEAPRLAFDTVVRPRREVDNAAIHGIGPMELTTAPTMDLIAGNIARSVEGRIVVAHNAPFDLRFLEVELERVGVDLAAPYIDTLFLVPALDIAPKMSLGQLRLRMQLPTSPVHIAAEDAAATAMLLQQCLQALHARGVVGVGELAQIPGTDSFSGTLARALPRPSRLVEGPVQSRAGRLGWAPSEETRTPPPASYADALMAALSDGIITDDEVRILEAIRDDAGLFGDQLKAIHAHALSWLLAKVAADQAVNANEEKVVGGAMRALKTLGWVPTPARQSRRTDAADDAGPAGPT